MIFNGFERKNEAVATGVRSTNTFVTFVTNITLWGIIVSYKEHTCCHMTHNAGLGLLLALMTTFMFLIQCAIEMCI